MRIAVFPLPYLINWCSKWSRNNFFIDNSNRSSPRRLPNERQMTRNAVDGWMGGNGFSITCGENWFLIVPHHRHNILSLVWWWSMSYGGGSQQTCSLWFTKLLWRSFDNLHWNLSEFSLLLSTGYKLLWRGMEAMGNVICCSHFNAPD